MTDAEIALVRDSFAHLHRRKAETGALFYECLFEIAPEVKPLFKQDIQAQSVKLMETLMVALAALHDKDGLTALLRHLGRQHRGYGVAEKHYGKVGEALIWTLRISLGQSLSAQAEQAWTTLYAEIARAMIAGGREQ